LTWAPSSATVGLRDLVDLLRSEWTKFRTVRGWLIGLLLAAMLCVLFTFLVADGGHEGGCSGPPTPGAGPNSPGSGCYTGHPFVPTGPDGEAVADTYQFVGKKMTGNDMITARVTSLTGLTSTNPGNVAPSLSATRPGLAGWAKAGIMVTSSTVQGSPYAAVMATGGHGVRFQYDYSHDRPGRPGAVSASSPRWLRLTRVDDTLTGYDSIDGANWTKIATTSVGGLPAAVNVGLFATSPLSFQASGGGAPTRATARFDKVMIAGRSVRGAWRAHTVGTGARDFYPSLGAGTSRRSGNSFLLAGSGDVAPAVNPIAGGDSAAETLLFGLIVSLIVVIVVATMFITVEYRRGLIRTTFAATPRRGRVLAAKVIVAGGVAFATGAAAAAVAIPFGEHILEANGNYVFPADALTVASVIAGVGALVALTAVAAVALGTIARRSAGAVTAGIILFVLPYIIGSFASASTQEWLFRLTPAAGFSVLGVLPRSALVESTYTMTNGYYPLSPWAGLAVLCVYAAIAVGLANLVLKRRDA